MSTDNTFNLENYDGRFNDFIDKVLPLVVDRDYYQRHPLTNKKGLKIVKDNNLILSKLFSNKFKELDNNNRLFLCSIFKLIHKSNKEKTDKDVLNYLIKNMLSLLKQYIEILDNENVFLKKASKNGLVHNSLDFRLFQQKRQKIVYPSMQFDYIENHINVLLNYFSIQSLVPCKNFKNFISSFSSCLHEIDNYSSKRWNTSTINFSDN